MRILITGASGQVGTNLALRCQDDGHDVEGVDCRANAWTTAFPCVVRDLVQADPDALATRDGRRPDVVVHLAAHAKVHELVQDPGRALENITMTHNVLDYCRRHGVPIVYASSREVYGDVCGVDAKEDAADFRRAGSPYAAGKIAGEAMVHAYARCYGLRYLVFRLSNVYGRFDNDLDRMQRVVPLFIAAIGDDKPVTIYGADKVIDFTYVDDCVDGIARGIDRLCGGSLRNETINLAFGEGHSLQELCAGIGAVLGKTPRVVLAPPRAGEVIRYVANLDRARALLGYAPKVGLHDGIRRAIAWGREWASRQAPPAAAAEDLSGRQIIA